VAASTAQEDVIIGRSSLGLFYLSEESTAFAAAPRGRGVGTALCKTLPSLEEDARQRPETKPASRAMLWTTTE
jgi:hypothetical protein